MALHMIGEQLEHISNREEGSDRRITYVQGLGCNGLRCGAAAGACSVLCSCCWCSLWEALIPGQTKDLLKIGLLLV